VITPSAIQSAASILLIDDNAAFLEVQAAVLRDLGYRVLVAAHAQAALRLLEASPVDIIITDILMPDRDGIELIQDVRRRWPAIRIVAVSGGGRIAAGAYLNLARSLGASAVLAKPFSEDELMLTIEQLQLSTGDVPNVG